MTHDDNSNSIPRSGRADVVLRRRSEAYGAADIMCFVIPAVQLIRIELIGTLSGSDILLVILFLCLLLGRKIQITTREGKTFLALGSLWLLSQIVTDIVRHSAFADLARGWSNVGLTLLNFCVAFSLMYRNRRRLELFGWGMVTGRILVTIFNPDTMMKGDPWKFGYSFAVTLAVFLIASRKDVGGRASIALSVFAGLGNFVFGTRAEGGFCLVAALYLSLSNGLHRRKGATVKLTTGAKAAIIAVLILGAAGTFWIYGYAAQAGILGEDARSKYESQSSGKYGLLLGGRIESLAYLPAIYDSPLLGHGSWAKDPLYITIELRTLALLGYDTASDISIDFYRDGVIPTHSYLFGAWVDAGIVGAIFWGWVFFLFAKGLLQVPSPTAPFVPLLSFVAFSTLWDIFFSPYGGEVRLLTSYYLVILMSCMAHAVPAQTSHALKAPGGRRLASTLMPKSPGIANEAPGLS